MISKAPSDLRSAAEIDSHESLEELKRAEAAFFDASATARSQGRRIPFTADIRCATRVVGRLGVEPVDAKIYEIQQGAFRNRYLDLVAHRPGGRGSRHLLWARLARSRARTARTIRGRI